MLTLAATTGNKIGSQSRRYTREMLRVVRGKHKERREEEVMKLAFNESIESTEEAKGTTAVAARAEKETALVVPG